MEYGEVERLALALPGTVTGTSYGTPALKVGGKLLARLKEDGTTLVLCAVLPDERDLLIGMAPAIYYVTDHYVGYPTMLIRLPVADRTQFAELLRRSWQRLTTPRRKPGQKLRF
jgi:hypothetical protein